MRVYNDELAEAGVEPPRETANFIRIQQYPDEELKGQPYHTKEIANGVKLVFAGSTLQTLLFPKNKFTMDSARDWAKSHGYKVGTGQLDPQHREEENGRPPADWFDRCTSAVGSKGNVDDPEAVCGNLYYNVMSEEVGNDISMEELIRLHDAIRHNCVSMQDTGVVMQDQGQGQAPVPVSPEQPATGAGVASKLPDEGTDFQSVRDWYDSQTADANLSHPIRRPRPSQAQSGIMPQVSLQPSPSEEMPEKRPKECENC
jgi:hypothetical protein